MVLRIEEDGVKWMENGLASGRERGSGGFPGGILREHEWPATPPNILWQPQQ